MSVYSRLKLLSALTDLDPLRRAAQSIPCVHSQHRHVQQQIHVWHTRLQRDFQRRPLWHLWQPIWLQPKRLDDWRRPLRQCGNLHDRQLYTVAFWDGRIQRRTELWAVWRYHRHGHTVQLWKTKPTEYYRSDLNASVRRRVSNSQDW